MNLKLNNKKMESVLFLSTSNCPNVMVLSEILPHIDTAYSLSCSRSISIISLFFSKPFQCSTARRPTAHSHMSTRPQRLHFNFNIHLLFCQPTSFYTLLFNCNSVNSFESCRFCSLCKIPLFKSLILYSSIGCFLKRFSKT